MKEEKAFKDIGLKVGAVIYMTALTIFLSYYISKIYEEEIWDNERVAITTFIAISFMATLIYLVVTEKKLLAMMSMYHFVLIGTIICVLLPIKYMPFMLIPMVMAAVYDLKAGFITSISVSCVMLVNFDEYPMYIFGIVIPVICASACFAIWKHKEIYKNMAGILFFVSTELVSVLAFKYYCDGIGMEYETVGFVVSMMVVGILTMVVANVLGILINWVLKMKTPAIYLKKISDDNFVAIRLIKNKSTSLYYHSTEVAELARLAARRIGADEELAYAGGIYHDLGKVAGNEYIKEGLALAEKYGIPKSVKAIMVEHNVKSRLPRSREAAIVMMCDTAISAVEYLKGTMDKKDMSEKVIIENALNKRVSSGALHKSGLTIEEFDKIKEVLVKIKEQQ
ncbi:MAG: HDIG domain-containing protein [Lachnospiraceae bacterium]|nr:HDIG domain-containing protein [Lachnospiraceae bacterium]